MSQGIYPVFEPALAGTKFDALGAGLAASFEALDRMALSAGLIPLTAFADNRPVPDGFEGDPDELAEVMGEWADWFDPAEGQAALQRLVEHVRANPLSAQQLNDPAEVVAELEEMARVLVVAAVEGVRFRLRMG